MKKFLIIVLVLSFTSLLSAEEKKYGAEITLTEKTEISKILEDAENYVGKKVLVEGTVVGVCAKRGCWINLSSDKEYETMRVKVNDGEIVFPMEAKGKKALVEGEVYSIVVKGDGCEGNCEGEGKQCEKKQETKKIYMIKGLGALIN